MLVALLLKEGAMTKPGRSCSRCLLRCQIRFRRFGLELHDLMIKQSDREGACLLTNTGGALPLVAEAHFTVGSLAWRAGRYDLALPKSKPQNACALTGKSPRFSIHKFCSGRRWMLLATISLII